MTNQLTLEDLDLILESLQYKKEAYRDSEKHPDYEFKQSQLKRVDDLADKIRSIIKSKRDLD